MLNAAQTSRHLGTSGIEVSQVALGTCGLGGGTCAGSAEEADAALLARALLESGRTIDTSNAYAAGRSEAVLGLALRGSAGDPRAAGAAGRIVTKVDAAPDTGVLDRDRVLRSYEESLERLGVDRVRLLHLHDPYTVSFEEATGPGGALEGLRELRDAGAVDAIGIAAGPIPLLTRYVDTGAFDVVLSHSRFTLVDRSARPLFENARARGMGVFNAAPFGAGILATGSSPSASYGYRPASAPLRDWVARVEAVCLAHATTLPAVALRFSTRSPLIDATVVGLSSARRLAQLETLQAADVPDAVWHELDALGAAPTPLDDADSGSVR